MLAITGGSGEIANRIAELLLEQEIPIVVYGRSTNPSASLAGVYIKVINYDYLSFN